MATTLDMAEHARIPGETEEARIARVFRRQQVTTAPRRVTEAMTDAYQTLRATEQVRQPDRYVAPPVSLWATDLQPCCGFLRSLRPHDDHHPEHQSSLSHIAHRFAVSRNTLEALIAEYDWAVKPLLDDGPVGVRTARQIEADATTLLLSGARNVRIRLYLAAELSVDEALTTTRKHLSADEVEALIMLTVMRGRGKYLFGENSHG